MRGRARSALVVLTLLHGGAILAAATPAEQAALRGLQARSFQARVDALTALKGSHDPAVVTAVAARLKDKDATVRWAAADTLEAMRAVAAVPALKTACNDPSPLVAGRARSAWAALSRGPGTARAEPAVRISTLDRTQGEPRLQALLLTSVKDAFAEKHVTASSDDAAPTSHAAAFTLQSIKETPAASGKVLEVSCTATVSEQPSGALRFATRVAAAVELPAGSSAADRREAVDDALKAAAGGLAEETLEWLAKTR